MEFLSLSRKRSSWQDVPGGEELGEKAAFVAKFRDERAH